MYESPWRGQSYELSLPFYNRVLAGTILWRSWVGNHSAVSSRVQQLCHAQKSAFYTMPRSQHSIPHPCPSVLTFFWHHIPWCSLGLRGGIMNIPFMAVPSIVIYYLYFDQLQISAVTTHHCKMKLPCPKLTVTLFYRHTWLFLRQFDRHIMPIWYNNNSSFPINYLWSPHHETLSKHQTWLPSKKQASNPIRMWLVISITVLPLLH